MEPCHGGSEPGRSGGISIELAIGVAIEARRLERRMTLGGLAHATNIPQPLLAEYEAGTQRAGGPHVLAIAAALDMGVGQLFRLHPRCPG
jgi:transcriptional regulator with XRE-family HTH domain